MPSAGPLASYAISSVGVRTRLTMAGLAMVASYSQGLRRAP
jgi:hypothetical protein